jgi:pyruvate dehydrogenase E1 component beta subunit/2-oxoisovalerate dehydrogenase E1 component
MDVVAVERAVHNAAESIRETSQPRFLELRTYRFRAHSMYDAELYRSKAEVQEHKKHDPITDFQGRAMSDGLVTQADIDTIEANAAEEIAEAVEFAEQGEWEPVENIHHHTYARDVS